MTINLPTISVMITVGSGILYLLRCLFQAIELQLKTMLWIARQQGWEIPAWLANQYKALNGNAKASKEEKHDVLGPKHDSNGKHKAANGGGK